MFNANPNIGILDPLEAKTVISLSIIETFTEIDRKLALGEQYEEVDKMSLSLSFIFSRFLCYGYDHM